MAPRVGWPGGRRRSAATGGRGHPHRLAPGAPRDMVGLVVVAPVRDTGAVQHGEITDMDPQPRLKASAPRCWHDGGSQAHHWQEATAAAALSLGQGLVTTAPNAGRHRRQRDRGGTIWTCKPSPSGAANDTWSMPLEHLVWHANESGGPLPRRERRLRWWQSWTRTPFCLATWCLRRRRILAAIHVASEAGRATRCTSAAGHRASEAQETPA